MNKEPWYKFWSPKSGISGGLVVGSIMTVLCILHPIHTPIIVIAFIGYAVIALSYSLTKLDDE